MNAEFNPELIENKLAEKAIGICIEVHKQLGPGLYESVYEEAIAYELDSTGIPYERQQEIPVYYKGTKLGLGFRADFIVDEFLLLEIKSVETLAPVHAKQLLTYLRLTKIRLGLLVNFNEPLLKDGIKRIANNLY